MGVVRRPDELQRVLEQHVAEGRASSQAALLEEAVMRLIDEARAEEDELQEAVWAGSNDIDAGRYQMVTSPEDERRLQDGMMARLRTRLSTDG